jgi:hypothetical protein
MRRIDPQCARDHSAIISAAALPSRGRGGS